MLAELEDCSEPGTVLYAFDEVSHWIEERGIRAQGQDQIITYQQRPLGCKPLSGLGPQATSVIWTNSVIHRTSR